MKTKLLLLLCLSVPAWAQIINNGGSGLPSGCSAPDVNTISCPAFTGGGYTADATPVQYFLGKYSTGTIVLATTSDTATPLVLAATTAAASKVTIAAVGSQATCAVDAGGATTLHYAIESTTTNGKCKDSGLTTAPTSGCWIGIFPATVSASTNGTVDVRPGCAPASGGTQTNGIVFTGTPNTTVAMTGSEVSVFEYKTDNTGIVNGTGITSSLFSATGQCLKIEILESNPAVATTYKLYYGGTSVTDVTTGAVAATGWLVTYVCTTTNTSTENIATAPYTRGTATNAPPGNTAVAVDGTTGQLIKFTANAASGNVTLKAAYITKIW